MRRERGSSSEDAKRWPTTGLGSRQPPLSGSGLPSRSPPPLARKEPRGVAAASSVSRCPHPRPSASARRPRGTRGRRGATTGPAASGGRVHRGAAAHLRPRDAARRPARPPLESECLAAATAPEAGRRNGPPSPEPASPRSAARHSHFGGGGGEWSRVGGLLLQAAEAEEMGGAVVTSRAGRDRNPRCALSRQGRAGNGRDKSRAGRSAGCNLGAERSGKGQSLR